METKISTVEKTTSPKSKLATRYLTVTLAFLALGVVALAVVATAQDPTATITGAARLVMILCGLSVALVSAFFAQRFFKLHGEVSAELGHERD